MGDNTIRLYYKKKLLKWQIPAGILYSMIGVSAFFITDVYFLGFNLIIGLAYFFQYYIWSKYGYISINNEYITRYRFWKKRIPTKDITKMKYYVGDLTLISEDKEMSIDKEHLKDGDFEVLENKIKSIIAENKSVLQHA
jgi:hypothetical protein